MKPIDKDHDNKVQNAGDDTKKENGRGNPESGEDTKKEIPDPIVKA